MINKSDDVSNSRLLAFYLLSSESELFMQWIQNSTPISVDMNLDNQFSLLAPCENHVYEF